MADQEEAAGPSQTDRKLFDALHHDRSNSLIVDGQLGFMAGGAWWCMGSDGSMHVCTHAWACIARMSCCAALPVHWHALLERQCSRTLHVCLQRMAMCVLSGVQTESCALGA
jgi:hypothetical protein